MRYDAYDLRVSFGLSNDNRFELFVRKPMTEKDWETFIKVVELFKESAIEPPAPALQPETKGE